MEAREFRIGNRIVMNDKVIEMDARIFHAVIHGFPGYIPEPIPLNKEWTEKLGFHQGRLDVSPFMHLTYNGQVVFLTIESGYTVIKNIQFVHQLQNLYFALTGEELSIK